MKFWSNLLFGIVLATSILSCNDTDDPNAQTNKETKAIDDYLKANNLDYVAYDNTSGTRIVIKQFGNDAPPHEGQGVKATYTARVFPDGAVFDAGEFDDLIDNLTVPGVQRGLASMLEGTHAVLYIPSKYAFGSNGTTGVPANTTVVYDITLDEVTRTSAEQTQFQKDTLEIHNWIKDPANNITGAVMHPSGFWYKVNSFGSGASPKPYDRVTFEYNGKLLSNGSSFGQGTPPQQGVFGLIDGLKVGMPLMPEGSSFTFYIPSGYGYGAEGVSGTIGKNANLIFEIKLNAVITQ